MAAAAAVAADFSLRHEASPPEDAIKQPEPAEDIAAPDSLGGPATAEIGVADAVADRSIVAEGVAVNPGSVSCCVTAIDIINPEADHLPVVTESATAHLLPAPSIFTEVVTPDTRLDHAAAYENHAGLEVDVAPMALVPPNEQLQRLVSETLAADQTVGMLSDGEWLPANLFAEANESSAGHAVDVLEEKPSTVGGRLAVISGEARSAALQGVEKCSVDMIAVKLEAALSEQVELGACEQPIVLRADYYGNRFSENAKNVEPPMGLRLRRNAKVEERSSNIPARRFIPRWPLSNLHIGIVALALLDVFLVGWRTDIVRKLPQTASFYALAGFPVNLRGLAFENISTNTVRNDGTPVLVVEGNVINDTRKNVRVPQIRFVVRDAAAQEIYSWTASAARTSLPPGQAATFRTRLASPPPGAHDLVLRFVSRRDAIAVIR